MTRVTPRQVAQAVLTDKGIGRRLPVSLHRVLENEPVLLETLSTVKPFEGRFEIYRNRPVIFLNLHGCTLEEPRVRFTLAHELGHYFLHRRLLRDGRVFHDRTIRYDPDLTEVEKEANEFASECLLPTQVVDERLKDKVLNLRLVQNLAAEATASLQATAIKLASLTRSRSCFFWEEDGEIVWTAPSDDWRYAKFRWAGWRGSLPVGSYASRSRSSFEEREVLFSSWCPNARERAEPLFESALSTSLGRLVFVTDGIGEVYG